MAPFVLRMPPLILLIALVGLPFPVRADDYDARAMDLVYEAADAIDSATSEYEAGRDGEGARLLGEAEGFLERAERIDASLPRVAYERARLQKLDRQPDVAEQTSLASMSRDLSFADHSTAVELLDKVRRDLGKPTMGVEWRQSMSLRDVGIGTIAGGLIAAIAGFAIAFGSFSHDAYNGVTQPGIERNRFGWGLSAVGGGVALAGGILTIAGQSKLLKLRAVLPGPWRLPGADPTSRRSVEVSFSWTFPLPQRGRS